jgi:O-antigen/teichoic acid export membrane protein
MTTHPLHQQSAVRAVPTLLAPPSELSSQVNDNPGDVESELVSMEVVKKRSIKGVISYAFRTLALQGIGLIAFSILQFLLGPEDFGIYYLVSAMIALFSFFSDIGLAAALVQKKTTPSIADLRTTFTVQQLLAFGIFFSIIALTPFWQRLGTTGVKLWLLYSLAFSFILASLKTIPSILLERELRFDLLVIPTMVENVIFYGVTILLAWRGFGVSSYIYAVLARSIFGLIVMYAIKRWPIGLEINFDSLRTLLKYGGKFQINDLLARIKDDLLVVVLGSWLPSAQLGYLTWALRWSKTPFQLSVSSVMAVTFPTYSRLQHDKQLLKKAIEKTLYFISASTFPMLAGIAVFVFPALNLIPKLHKWEPAVWCLVFFTINIAGSAISTPLTNTLNAIGKINGTLKLMVMWTALTWISTPICLYFFGYQGVAVASALVSLTSIVTVWMVKRHIPINVWPSIRMAIFATTVFIAVGIIGNPLWGRSWLHLLIGMMLSCLSYAGIFILFGRHRLQTELRSLGLKV